MAETNPLDLSDSGVLARFHAGDRGVMGALYQESFDSVDGAVARVLRGADRETVVREVYLRLLDHPDLRRSFQGGSFAAWADTLAYHQAVDFWRRHRRETSWNENEGPPILDVTTRVMEERAELRVFIDRFVRETLPPKWLSVFQARFLEGLDQREAACRLGMHRITLAYQETRIRKLLRASTRAWVKP